MTKRRAKPSARAKSPTKKKAKHGGVRAGAGRKRDKLPEAVVERLKEVPTDAAGLDTWVRRFLAELLVLQMKGEVSVDLAQSLRATCGEIRRAMPPAPPAADVDDDDDDEEIDGPDLEDVTPKKEVEDVAHGALRIG